MRYEVNPLRRHSGEILQIEGLSAAMNKKRIGPPVETAKLAILVGPIDDRFGATHVVRGGDNVNFAGVRKSFPPGESQVIDIRKVNDVRARFPCMSKQTRRVGKLTDEKICPPDDWNPVRDFS